MCVHAAHVDTCEHTLSVQHQRGLHATCLGATAEDHTGGEYLPAFGCCLWLLLLLIPLLLVSLLLLEPLLWWVSMLLWVPLLLLLVPLLLLLLVLLLL
jgi:hypothetical protein